MSTTIKTVDPQPWGYLVSTTDDRELRFPTGLNPRSDMILAALEAYLRAHPGEPCALDLEGGPP